MYFVCFEAEFCNAQDPGRTPVVQVRKFVLLYRSGRVGMVERKASRVLEIKRAITKW